jgi:hypothetical protein
MAKKKPPTNLSEIPDPNFRRGKTSKEPIPSPPPLTHLPNEIDVAVLEQMAEEARLRDLREWQALFPSNDVSSLDAGRLQRVVTELAKRKIEGLRLYEPMPEQERFHASNARIRILRGSNRGGKMLPSKWLGP